MMFPWVLDLATIEERPVVRVFGEQETVLIDLGKGTVLLIIGQ